MGGNHADAHGPAHSGQAVLPARRARLQRSTHLLADISLSDSLSSANILYTPARTPDAIT
jgi:hypothetical protein